MEELVKPIVIQTTPEMANWMHPQTEERKRMISDSLERRKLLLKQHRKMLESSTPEQRIEQMRAFTEALSAYGIEHFPNERNIHDESE